MNAVTSIAAAPVALASLDAECSVLGGLMYDNAWLDRMGNLRPEHFFEPTHSRLFAAIERKFAKGVLADPISLFELLKADEGLIELGGLPYMAELVVQAPLGPHVAAEHAKIIVDLAIRRELINFADETADTAKRADIPGRELIVEAEQKLFNLGERGSTGGGFVTFESALAKSLDATAEAYSRDGGLSGLSTGLMDLDHKLGGLHPSDLIILAGRPSMGKEQPVDTPILTPSGWSVMGAIRPGDEVIGVNGAPVIVTGVFPQGVKQAYRVSFRDLTSVECGIDHLWTVYADSGRNRLKPQTLRLSEILAKGIDNPRQGRRHAKWKVPLVAPIQFSSSHDPLPVDPYVLGVLLGDGSLSGTDLRFSNPDMDSDIRARCAVALPGIELHENRSGACPYFAMRGPGKAALKASLGAMGARVLSGEKSIPAEYLTASPADRMALLRGLMDTDGSCVQNSSVFHTISQQLARGVADLARSLGAVAINRAYDRRPEGRPIEFQVRIRSAFCPFLTARKVARWRPQAPARYIHSVEPTREVEQVCIQVAATDGLYVTDNYIVTHNTALATNIAFHIANHFASERQADGSVKTTSGGVVGFFSLEMSEEQLAARILAEVSGVPSDAMRRGTIKAHEYGQIKDAAMAIGSAPLFIDATGALSIGKLAARARRLKRTSGLDCIVVDYLQLATADRSKNDGRVQEVSEVTMGLKALAKELSVPVLALSQLSRKVEERDDKRPQLADLRESGSIEQDADVVMFVYREAYYLARTEPKPDSPEHATWAAQMDDCRGLAEVVIGKQRHGPIGTVKLAFNEDLTKFGNLAKEGHVAGRFPYGRDD